METKFIGDERMKLYCADCLKVLPTLENESVHAVVCDPPYFLINEGGSGFMGKSWDSFKSLDDILFLWKTRKFAESAVSLLLSLEIEKNGRAESSAQENALIRIDETESQFSLAPSAENNLSERNHNKKASSYFVAGIALTKQEVLELLNELCPSHITAIESQNENALFVIPTSFIRKLLKNTVLESALNEAIITECSEKTIRLSSMEEARIDAVIAAKTGKPYDDKFMRETTTLAESAENTAEEKKYKLITLNATSKPKIIQYLTLLLCAFDATPNSKTELFNYLIQKWNEAWATECLRVLKTGGFLLAFGGTRTHHRLTCALEDAGFKIIDEIIYGYAQGFPKAQSLDKLIDQKLGVKQEREVIGKLETHRAKRDNVLGEEYHSLGNGKETAPASVEARRWVGWKTPSLKPAWEPIILAQKPCAGSITENVLKHEVGGFNIDACRIPINEGERIPRGNIPYEMKADNNFGGGHDARKGTITETFEEGGRFPSNLILTDPVLSKGVEGVVLAKDAPETEHNPRTTKDLKEYVYAGGWKGGEQQEKFFAEGGSYNKFFMIPKTNAGEKEFKYCVKCGKPFGDDSKHFHAEHEFSCLTCGVDYSMKQKKEHEHHETKNNFISHPTTKPIDLMKHLIKLVTREGQIVLDPFAGSGTTLLACRELHRDCIAIEKNEEYCEIAKARFGTTLGEKLDYEDRV